MSYLIKSGRYAGMIAKPSNRSGAGGVALIPGIIVTTGAAGIDIIHAIPLLRSFYIIKLMWYNAGAQATLAFGTLNNAGIPALVQLIPTQIAFAGLTGGMEEDELAGIEFMLNSQAAPAGWDGSLYVTSSLAGVQVSAEIAEKL